ncbi:MAG: GMC family oxidoreductase N-terminal domain-containing protein [Candidatus Latescibacterota bacterium]
MAAVDYVIVGAGSAGCALAHRLSQEAACLVLLVEAGRRDASPLIALPRGYGKILTGTRLLWRYPVAHPAGQDGPEVWLRGRVLGGSSAVNGMLYTRGSPAGYDGLDLDGWGWREIGPVFRAMEDHELGPGPCRGTGGPLKITVHPARQALCEAVIAAAESLGVPRTEDLNEAAGECVGYHPRTIWRGRRQSAATAFLHPVRWRPNLRILTRTEVLRVVFEGRRAVGVETRRAAGQQLLTARREVVLCAGALHSPKLLMLSGIGPAEQLAAHGIPVVAEAPQVGSNLVEQRALMPAYRVSHGSDAGELRGMRLLRNALRYALWRSGPLTYGVFEVSALVKTRPDLPRPDAQISFRPFAVVRQGTRLVADGEPGCVLCCYILDPRSRGRLALQSPDPGVPPRIEPNYLSDEGDRRASVEVFRLTRRLFCQPAVQAFAPREVSPGPAVQTDDEVIACYVEHGAPAVHTCGTCRMGNDPLSVVDLRLRVRGVEGLRVADLSVLPRIVSGNTNAPAMALGWRAAELILG